jgi:hypothetical protein
MGEDLISGTEIGILGYCILYCITCPCSVVNWDSSSGPYAFFGLHCNIMSIEIIILNCGFGSFHFEGNE